MMLEAPSERSLHVNFLNWLLVINAQLTDDVVQYASVQQAAACVLKDLGVVVGRGDAFVPQPIFSV